MIFFFFFFFWFWFWFCYFCFVCGSNRIWFDSGIYRCSLCGHGTIYEGGRELQHTGWNYFRSPLTGSSFSLLLSLNLHVTTDQSIHDILYHRHHLDSVSDLLFLIAASFGILLTGVLFFQYDHLEFPGVVPRTFIGKGCSISLSSLVSHH